MSVFHSLPKEKYSLMCYCNTGFLTRSLQMKINSLLFRKHSTGIKNHSSSLIKGVKHSLFRLHVRNGSPLDR